MSTQQLALPTLDGVTFPEGRIAFSGSLSMPSDEISDLIGQPRVGDRIDVRVSVVVGGKRFRRKVRQEAGLEVIDRVCTHELVVESIDVE